MFCFFELTCITLCTEWDVQGPDRRTRKISEKWLKPLITKSLINYRWKLNQLIDAGKRRPPEVSREHWNTLMANRKTEHSRKKSDQMRSISAGKGSKANQLRSIEKDSLIKLVRIHLNCFVIVICSFVGMKLTCVITHT